MPSPDRITRVNELIKREIACILESKEFEEECLISVTQVKTSPDLRHAKVYISVLGGDNRVRRKAMRYLERNRGDFQKKMSRNIVLKYTPVLEFIPDLQLEEADRLLSIMAELEKDDSNL